MYYSIDSGIRQSVRFQKFVRLVGYGEPFMYGLLIRAWEWGLERVVNTFNPPFPPQNMFSGIGWVKNDISRPLQAFIECGESPRDGYLIPKQYGKVVFNYSAFEEHFHVEWAVRYYTGWLELSDAEFEKQFTQTRLEVYDPGDDIRLKGMITFKTKTRQKAEQFMCALHYDMLKKRKAHNAKKSDDTELMSEKVSGLPTLDSGFIGENLFY